MPVPSLRQWTFFPSLLMGDMGFTAPQQLAGKICFMKTLLTVFWLLLLKSRECFQKQEKSLSTSATDAFKAKGIWEAWELRAWGWDPIGIWSHRCSVLPQVRTHQLHMGFVGLDWNGFWEQGCRLWRLLPFPQGQAELLHLRRLALDLWLQTCREVRDALSSKTSRTFNFGKVHLSSLRPVRIQYSLMGTSKQPGYSTQRSHNFFFIYQEDNGKEREFSSLWAFKEIIYPHSGFFGCFS